MFGIGSGELALILLFAFMIFGPDKLPGAGRTLGRALRQFRQAQEGFTKVVQAEVINPMTEGAKDDGPTIEDELDADIDDDTTESATPRKETFAERKARLEAERAKAQDAQEERSAATPADEKADTEASSEVSAENTDAQGASADEKTSVQDADSDEDIADEVVEAEDDTEDVEDAAPANTAAALYGLSASSAQRAEKKASELSAEHEKKKEATEPVTPADIVTDAATGEAGAEPGAATAQAKPAKDASAPVRVVAAARKKPRQNLSGKGEGA